jgi:hypothetical protein
MSQYPGLRSPQTVAGGIEAVVIRDIAGGWKLRSMVSTVTPICCGNDHPATS